MSILIPEAPGNWTEAVLIAFPQAQITQDYPETAGGGVLHVTLPLSESPTLEIEFRRDEFRLADAPESYSANLQEYAPDHGLDSEIALFEATDIDLLCRCVQEWVEQYRLDMISLADLENVPEDWLRDFGGEG